LFIALDPRGKGFATDKLAAAETDGWNRGTIMDAAGDHVRDVGFRAVQELRNGCQRQQPEIVESRTIEGHKSLYVAGPRSFLSGTLIISLKLSETTRSMQQLNLAR
jgi:hypothetical protein